MIVNSETSEFKVRIFRFLEENQAICVQNQSLREPRASADILSLVHLPDFLLVSPNFPSLVLRQILTQKHFKNAEESNL